MKKQSEKRTSTGLTRRPQTLPKHLEGYIVKVASASETQSKQRKKVSVGAAVKLDHSYSSTSKDCHRQEDLLSKSKQCKKVSVGAAVKLDHSYSSTSKTAVKRKIEESLEDRYIKNAAVLPEISPAPTMVSASALSVDMRPVTPKDEPVFIHGHTTQGYQSIYHSIKEPLLRMPSSQPHPYNLQLGITFKQHLWTTLKCPRLLETEQPDGRVHVSEVFHTPTRRSFAPNIQVDISGEPLPKPPKNKRCRH